MVFYYADVDKEEVAKLKEDFSVKGIPNFVLVDPEGETIDRWYGYDGVNDWLETFAAALADPTTVAQKRARFEKAPTAKDAMTLARTHLTRGEAEEAVGLYRKAQELDKAAVPGTVYPLFEATVRGYLQEKYSFDDVQKAADAVLEHRREHPAELVELASTMEYVAQKAEKPEAFVPYLQAALEATEGTEDAELQKERKKLLVSKALHVDKDKEKALALKRETLPEGWQDDAGKLNGFAWWCFENEVNLEEAEQLARKAVELAKPGREKAMILDTLAEICNARGSCEDALEVMKQALAEDPDNEHYKKQLERFEDLVAKAKKEPEAQKQ